MMRMLETRQANTSPSKYIIELTHEELRQLFNEDTRQQIINKILVSIYIPQLNL